MQLVFFWKKSKLENNIVIDISPPTPYREKFKFSTYGSKCCRPIKLKNSLKRNILRKKWTKKFVLGIQIKIKVFYIFLGVRNQVRPKYPK